MTIVLMYRGTEACFDTCNDGLKFLDKTLEKIVEEKNPKTGERMAIYRFKKDNQENQYYPEPLKTVFAVERYFSNRRKEDYDLYVAMTGKVSDLENPKYDKFKEELDRATGINGKVGKLIGWKRSPLCERRNIKRNKKDTGKEYLQRREYKRKDMQESLFSLNVFRRLKSYLNH